MVLKRIILLLFITIGGVLTSLDLLAQNKNRAADIEKTEETVSDSLNLKKIKNAPIVVFNDTLFYIYGDVGVVTAVQRAEIIEKNIIKIAKDALFNKDSVTIIENMDEYQIRYYDKVIVGITDKQARVIGKTKEEVASDYRKIIVNRILEEKNRNGWKDILLQIGLALLVIVTTYFSFKLINRIFRKIRVFVSLQHKRTIKPLYYIIDADKQIALALWLVKFIRLLIVLIILYFCIFSLFSIFPETKWLSNTLIGYIISPLKIAIVKIIEFIPDLITIIVTIIIFKFIVKIIRIFAERIADESIHLSGFYPDWAIPTFNIIKVILYIFMFIIIFPHLPGSDSPIFKGVSMFLGVLFSLGSTSVIGNIVSGLVITYMRPFKIGDRIRMGEFLGNVIEKTPLVTRIKTPKNEVVTIPNASIMSAHTVNYTSSADEYGLILYAKVTVGYEIPWRKVHELLIEAGSNIHHVLTEPKPFILQIALDDFYVEYQINIYTKEANSMANIYSDLNKNVQDIFNREGIELVSPHYRAQRDGSELTMPKEYLKPDKFKAAPFNIHIIKEAETKPTNNNHN